ncbi:MAG: hypothetical protein J6A83_03260 [Clostridia bacterium]|nr:hypothetical protein [Clostridia bacterium]
MQFRNLEERIEFLRENPIFWSPFGTWALSGTWTHSRVKRTESDCINDAEHAKRHKAMFDKGIVVHSSIIPTGWIAPDTYDYTETDNLFELLFSTAPDILFMPRVCLNVPAGWCAQNPEDVFVYAEGPRTKEEIVAMIDTPPHGSHPWKETDLLAWQSFSSKKWVKDASEALHRLVTHIENSKWASNIIGYHIAYGTHGETSQWGTWIMDPRKKGDYGISATKAFIEYAAKRGKNYDSIPAIDERFFITDKPIPNNKFHIGYPTLDKLFYHTEQDEKCVIYSEFSRDTNMDAVEAFGKVVKDIVPEKVTGVFHGYISEPNNSANTPHTGFERLLNSPYIDFIAAPKGYVRVGPTEPGFGQSVPNSINRKKLYIDEIDNRTHICKNLSRPGFDHPAKNFAQTRAVYWREFTKNIVFHQGYWWMDLGGGWLDSEEIRNEIALLNETSKQLYREKDTHKSVSEVLLVINEDVMHHMRPNYALHDATIGYTGSTIKASGVPVDLYRTADLEEIDLSKYKMIVFLNAFYADSQKLHKILERTSSDCHIVWNYAAGIIEQADGSFGFENVRRLTGFSLGEYPQGAIAEHADSCFPVLYVNPDKDITPIAHYSDGRIKTAKLCDANGRTHILSAMPSDMTVEAMRELLISAGVHLYAPAHCTVHADNRFVYVISGKTAKVEITLREPMTCRNEFTGEVFKNAKTICADMEEGTGIFLKYIKD